MFTASTFKSNTSTLQPGHSRREGERERGTEGESEVVAARGPDGNAAGVPTSVTISHRCEFEDGVQGTLQVRQVVWKQRHNSEPPGR